MLTKFQAGSAAWRIMKEIVENADMSEAVPLDTEDRDQIINAIYELAEDFNEHAADLDCSEDFLGRKLAEHHAKKSEENTPRRLKLVVPTDLTDGDVDVT